MKSARRKWEIRDHHPYEWLAIFHEEFGEAVKNLLEGKSYGADLVQAAAVLLAWLVDGVDLTLNHL